MQQVFTSLTSDHLRPHLPELGGSVIILQRNASVLDGHIETNDAKQANELAKMRAIELLESLEPDDRSSIDFLVIGSDPRLGVDNEAHPESLATLETAKEVLSGIHEAMQSLDIKDAQLINTTAVPKGGVVEISEIKSWLPINDSLELIGFLQKKSAQTGEELSWLYETDAYKEEREKLGVEGAKSIALRLQHFLSSSKGSTNYHAAHPGRRLVFWMVTRFDTITPYLREILAHPAECSAVIPVEHLGGILINITPDRAVRVIVGDKEYATNLSYQIVTG